MRARPGGQPSTTAADRRAVAFTPGCHAEKMTEGVVGHRLAGLKRAARRNRMGGAGTNALPGSSPAFLRCGGIRRQARSAGKARDKSRRRRFIGLSLRTSRFRQICGQLRRQHRNRIRIDRQLPCTRLCVNAARSHRQDRLCRTRSESFLFVMDYGLPLSRASKADGRKAVDRQRLFCRDLSVRGRMVFHYAPRRVTKSRGAAAPALLLLACRQRLRLKPGQSIGTTSSRREASRPCPGAHPAVALLHPRCPKSPRAPPG